MELIKFEEVKVPELKEGCVNRLSMCSYKIISLCIQFTPHYSQTAESLELCLLLSINEQSSSALVLSLSFLF